MRGVTTSDQQRREAVRLRVEERRSLSEISALTTLPQATVYSLVRQFPLSEQERTARRRGPPKKPRGQESKFQRMVGARKLDRSEKGRIAEAAALYRLTLFGLRAFSSVFDGDRIDWLVETPRGKTVRIQVRWAKNKRHGLPTLNLKCSNGRGRYRRLSCEEFDFLVGYDLYSDTAFVYSANELSGNQSTVSVSEPFAEKWEKVVNF